MFGMNKQFKTRNDHDRSYFTWPGQTGVGCPRYLTYLAYYLALRSIVQLLKKSLDIEALQHLSG